MLVSLFVLTTNIGFCQTKKVTIEVIDIRTEERIPGATIVIVDSDKKMISDSDGEFSLEVEGKGTAIEITSVNYKAKQITVTPTQSLLRVGLISSSNDLQEVVVSGTQKLVRKSDSPIPVESYSSKFLKKNVTPSFFEALQIINGVQPQLNCNVCGTGDIHINGMEGPYTLILIDGMPIVSNLASVYGLSGIPAAMVKRIEIVKGPASTLYGSEAMGGLINIITQDPLSALKFTIDANATSKSEYNTDITGKFKIGKATSMLGINYFNYDNKADVNGDNFTDVTLQNRLSLFNKWSFARASNQPFNVALRYVWENRWGGDVRWNKSFRGGDSLYAENIITNRFELIGNYGIKIGTEKLLLEYSYNSHKQDAAYGTTPYIGTQNTGFAQLRWDKKIGKNDLLIGIPFKHIWLDDNTTATLDKDRIKNKPFIDAQQGVFVQNEFHFSDQFTTLAGVRYEYNITRKINIISPRLAFKYQPSKNTTVRLSGGNGFRNVNIFLEDHASLIGIRELVIKEELKPERSWNGTLNYTSTYPTSWGFLGIDVSTWYTYFTNKIIPDVTSDATKIIYSNTDGHAVSKGASANIDFTFKNGFKGLLGTTLMDVYQSLNDGTGNFLKQQQLFAPKFSATYVLSYNTKKHGWSFDLTGKVYGPQRLPIIAEDAANGIKADFRPEYSPTFTLMNLQITKKVNHHFELYLAGKNLLNFMPKNPIMRTGDPFDKDITIAAGLQPYNQAGYVFEPSYNYAPMQGIKVMAGFRYSVH